MQIIAIAGGSCSGKTSLATGLAERLDCPHLSMDCFYKDFSLLDPTIRRHINWDDPRAIDFARLTDVVVALANGRPAFVNDYDFSKDSPAETGTEYCPHGDHLIVEGLFMLGHRALLEYFDLKVFLSCDAETRVARRVNRDVHQRGRDLDDILRQLREFVLPAHDLHVEPMAADANLVLDGTRPTAELVELLLDTLRSRASGVPTRDSASQSAIHSL